MNSIHIQFIEADGSVERIIIEHPAGVRGLERIWQVLFRHQVDVTSARVGVVGERIQLQLIVLQGDGSPVSSERRGDLRDGLLRGFGSTGQYPGSIDARGGSAQHRLGSSARDP